MSQRILHVFAYDGVLYQVIQPFPRWDGAIIESTEVWLESEGGESVPIVGHGLGAVRKAIEALDSRVEFDEDREEDHGTTS